MNGLYELSNGYSNFSYEHSTESCITAKPLFARNSVNCNVIFSNSEIELAKYEDNKKKLVQQYMKDILSIISQDEFIDGETSQSSVFIVEAQENGEIEYIKDALMELYLQKTRDSHVLEGIMVMISSVKYDEIAPQGPIMALGLLQHEDLSIRDRAIQCYEQWNSKKGLEPLKSLNCHPKWLQRYVEKVIAYIESDGIQ